MFLLMFSSSRGGGGHVCMVRGHVCMVGGCMVKGACLAKGAGVASMVKSGVREWGIRKRVVRILLKCFLVQNIPSRKLRIKIQGLILDFRIVTQVETSNLLTGNIILIPVIHKDTTNYDFLSSEIKGKFLL